MRNETVEKYYRENYDTLIKYARRRVGNYSLPVAEDAVQEAFYRALKYFTTYNNEESFDGWFKSTLSNTINHIKGVERDQGLVMTEEKGIVTDARMKSVILSKEVIDEINNSSDRDRRVFEAYFFFGLKTREISEVIPVSHSNVRYLISKFREKMQT